MKKKTRRKRGHQVNIEAEAGAEAKVKAKIQVNKKHNQLIIFFLLRVLFFSSSYKMAVKVGTHVWFWTHRCH